MFAMSEPSRRQHCAITPSFLCHLYKVQPQGIFLSTPDQDVC
jgi:hypothetical protein